MAPPLFRLKSYQQNTLAALRRYLMKCVEFNDAATAFYALTGRPYIAPPSLPDLPYICLRIPTGGGKTLLAAHSIRLVTDDYLRTDTPTVLWLVPSQTIRKQTLTSLQDRTHRNRLALTERFGENLRIMGVSDALYAKRGDYDTGAVVIVATLQAFRIEDQEGRKVYEANGELMDHFTQLPEALQDRLQKGPAGTPLPSLANVLRLRRPIIIVDEAHNARTDLSFDTLAGLAPSLIVELTATPVTPSEHNPKQGKYASNVLHHVSAAELKAEEMIKLPIILRGRPDPRDTMGDAMAWLDELTETAKAEQKATGEFIRPVMLLQAEPQSKNNPYTLHAEKLKSHLVEDFRVPDEHVVIATGDTKGLEGVDLFDPQCRIRFIITQQALKEGWDCSFAYVLCSVAEQKSARAVEQLLGRVLRLPRAYRKQHEDLNRAYAFATTTSFQHAAQTLRDGLVANGFEHVEVKELVHVPDSVMTGLEEGGSAFVYEEELPDDDSFAGFQKVVHDSTGGRVTLDTSTNRLRATGALSDYDRTALKLALPAHSHQAIDSLVHRSRGARLANPEQNTILFAVPRLCVIEEDQPQLFDRTHFLDIPWPLDDCEAEAILQDFVPPRQAGDEAHLDIDAKQEIKISFINDVHAQLALALAEQGWTQAALINWIDRRLPPASRQDITRHSSTLYITKALDCVAQRYTMDIEDLARAKFNLVSALTKTIKRLRERRETEAFEQALRPHSGLDFLTSSQAELVFNTDRHSYSEPYKGSTTFQKHLFKVVGDLKDSGEEFDCAVHIERNPHVRCWVRNTVHINSFWLQTATGKFYPDFLALLDDGRIMAVEYKGDHLDSADEAKHKRLIGTLWAERSQGRCLFVWVADRQYGDIAAALA